jgi:tyrosyl-tRNA synthetase
MGKTEGNIISFEDSPEDMFGKVMSWNDSLIISGFELCTDITLPEIQEFKSSLSKGTNPKEIKIKLAFEVVKVFFGEKKAEEAKNDWILKFEKKGIPENLPKIENREKPWDTIYASGAVSSTSVARRLLDQGAVTDLTENKKVTQKDKFKSGHKYKIGSHTFFEIK